MPLITLSQSLASGGSAIARRVADTLGYPLFDDDRLQQMSVSLGLHREELGILGERAPGLLDRIFTRLPKIYLDVMEAVVFSLSREGEGVIIGHGSPFLLRDFDCAFHVRIHAPVAERVRRLVREDGMAEATAAALVKGADQRQAGFYRWAFQMEWDHPDLYDLVLHPGKIGESTAADLIIAAVGSEEVSACGIDAIQALDRRSLQKRVHAAVVDAGIDVFTLQVDVPEPGTVHLSGMVRSLEERERLPEAARSVKGVETVVNHTTLRAGGW